MLVFIFSCFIEIYEHTNGVDPDQMQHSAASDQHSAASDLGLHCLPMSLLWDARLIWVNPFTLSGLLYHISLDLSISSSNVSD